MKIYHHLIMFCLALGTIGSTSLHAEEKKADTKLSVMDGRVQDLKKDILDLNRDLFILEEELLFPANTQFTVFLSMDTGKLFNLDSVQLKLNDKIVANHLYTEQESKALFRGGVQRVYIGNLPTGKHELVALFTGQGPKGRTFRRAASVTVEKVSNPKFVELKITDDVDKQQPRFDVKVWE
ncbi:MAG: AraC family transcriptional regulator [Gammaproteobacteria bacterium]|nr:AraC family transcriptional regulator [Gammaproteobacteria bacterium]MDH5651561.1 AraC family transcriptional regulator [Gammaproteobacteria bacterium]